MNELQRLLVDEIAGAPHFERLAESLEAAKPGKPVLAKGLRGSSLSSIVATLAHKGSAPAAGKKGGNPPSLVVLVTGNYERAGEHFDDLQFFGIDDTFHFPKSQVLPYDEDEPLLEEQVKHLEFLHWLSSHESGVGVPPAVDGVTRSEKRQRQAAVCIVPVEALFTRVAPLKVLQGLTFCINWGERLEPDFFAQRAADLGYDRVPTVEARGEFAVRGGILDIFPLDAENPVRIDLFGDEIESIRAFDVHTQRSLRGADNIERVTILPAKETVLINAALGRNQDDDAAAQEESLRAMRMAPGEKLPTLLDLMPEDALLVLDGPESYTLLDERSRQLAERQFEHHRAERPGLAPPDQLFATLAEVEAASRRFIQLHHTLVVEGAGRTGITFESTSFETVKPSLEHYITQIRRRMADGQTVVIVCDNDGQAQRMDEMLRENTVGSAVFDPEKDDRLKSAGVRTADRLTRDVIVAVGLLHSGFILPEAGLYIVTDREIFGRYKRRHVYRKIYKGAPIADAREIRKGDFVVHLEHGVGRFEGIRSQNVDNRITDFVELTYADDDKLLVPVEKIAYVQKFSGPEQAPPVLDKIGGKKWASRRKKSEEEIKVLAGELLKIHARRAMARGYAYGEDSLWQREFESSFLYTETPDQLRAINDVKRDMAGEKPMDRLVCGDVGYGKTEVAIRAAFKSIMDKKQVALLCPTTILAQQHYENFKERFADYPIRVQVLSRFQTAKEVKETLKGLVDGAVNMVVGTHMLLSKSVQFKDLGLVVVDEEQRFGVSHKERLKEMRASVDFLTLTATPIPRTLYMALSGIRDMSVINTPPADRQPIKTKVINWDREQIEEAILRELNRGGQVFFVHNRVQNIHAISEKVREIVPTARIAIAHGQMPERDLEQVMIDFIDRKFDILVSTTIIESGVDIPNCNTIIINRADTFGLAQLYQIRGRVGRENRRAYAYLIIPAGEAITEHAIARLQAIEEFTELGVGFNIAMRDMEIRGTGNLLGKEQHGTMNAVGFELYCKMLEDAVDEIRGDAREEEERDVEVVWKVSANIPAQFVPVESQRVMLYKRIAEASTVEALDEVAAEVRDRYGEVKREVPAASDAASAKGSNHPAALANAGAKVAAATSAASPPKLTTVIIEDLPEPIDNIFCIARLRILGRKLNLKKITGTKTGFIVHRESAVVDLGPQVSTLLKGGNPKVYTDNPHQLEFHYADWNNRRPLQEAVHMVQRLVQMKH